MESSSIYLTLPSSASLDLYPDNTLARYKVELGSELHLDKNEYEIGLVEFQLNANIFNIEKDYEVMTLLRSVEDVEQIARVIREGKAEMKYENLKRTMYQMPEAKYIGDSEHIDYEKEGPPTRNFRVAIMNNIDYYSCKIYISKGYYSNMRTIIDVINKSLRNNIVTTDLRFILDDAVEGMCYKVELISTYGMPISTNDRMFIYPSAWFDYGTTSWKKSDYDFQLKYIFDYKRMIDAPLIAYVYMDIVEHQFIGNVKAQVIRAVHLRDGLGSYSVIYENPHYVNLNTSEIKTISVYIRDTQGDLIQFDRGSLSIKCHIRKKTI